MAETDTTAQTTSDDSAQNTGATVTDAATQTAQQPAAQTDITKTPEFKAALTAAIERKIPQLKSQIAKTITGEGEGTPTVAELQQQLTDATKKAQGYEAGALIRDYVTDPKHKVNVRPENVRVVEKLVMAEIEFDDDGKVSNLKEAIESVKNLAPALFAGNNVNINQSGGKTTANPLNMNDFIRQIHAGRN